MQKYEIWIFSKFVGAQKNGAFETLKGRMVLKSTAHVQEDISIDCE